MEKNYALENPREIFTNFSGKDDKKVTLAVECHMHPARTEDGVSPQKIFGKFTRLVFTIIKDRMTVKANVNFEELPDIEERTSFARNKVYEAELMENVTETEADLPPAYTTTFVSGVFKGRTPAEIVLEDPEGNRGKLREQYEFLKNNADKYPKNRTIMHAITNAYELYKDGKLEKREKKNNRTFEIYKSGYRPQTRDRREDGKCKVKEMSVVCNIGNRYPIEINISEYYAPVTNNNGRLNVQMSAADTASLRKVTAYMAMKDWNCLLSKVNDQRTAFIVANGEKLLQEANNLYQEKLTLQKAV